MADRISSLTDDLLLHIHSFIPTPISMSTSIFSRRWRHLWTRVPVLDLNAYSFRDNEDEGQYFTRIVYRAILKNEAPQIDTFRLRWRSDQNLDEFDLETWVDTVIKRKVKNIAFSLNHEVTLPMSLFKCQSLVELTLENCTGIPHPNSTVSLPRLRKLHLHGFFFARDGGDYEPEGALPRLLSGCPVLEELAVGGSIDEQELDQLTISSFTVRTLILDFPISGIEFENPNYVVNVDAPALKYMKLIDCSFKHIHLSPITSASLSEGVVRLNAKFETGEDRTTSVVRFINGLHNVKCLRVVSSHKLISEENLDLAGGGSFARFLNLTKMAWGADYLLLSKFLLETAENLEILIIREGPKENLWIDPHRVPTCLLSNLRSIAIYEFRCTEHEFSMVHYLLRNARVLERMEIFFQDRTNEALKAKADAVVRVINSANIQGM